MSLLSNRSISGRHLLGSLFVSSMIASLGLVSGCSASDGSSFNGDNGGGGGSAGANASTGGSAGSGNAGSISGNAGSGGSSAKCASQVYSSQVEPGAVLILFDFSSSMEDGLDGQDAQFGDPTKWQVTTQAVNQLLDGLPNELHVGLFTFPNGSSDACTMDPDPNVGIDKLSITRGAIESLLNPNGGPSAPFGGNTPLADGMAAAHTYLHNYMGVQGEKSVLLVTDGADNCSNDKVYDNALLAVQNFGQRTFVIGLNGSSESDLSLTAANGGTPRMQGCQPSCVNPDLCCHYAADGSDTQSVLATALGSFADDFISSCVFQVPKGDPPSNFDPGFVNVVVTYEGESPKQVFQDSSTGWTYTDGTYNFLVVHGAECEKIKSTKASVEVYLGCKTNDPVIQ